jgi:tetratricopeptide (TPR) repeat protein
LPSMKNCDSRRLPSAALTGLAGILLLTGCAAGGLYDKYYDQGLELMKSQNYAQAENAFSLAEKQALKMDAGDARRIAVWSELAMSFAVRDLPENAEEYLLKARKDRESSPKSDPKLLVQAISETATRFEKKRAFAKALELRRSALAIQNSVSGKDGVETLALARACAQTSAKSGDLKEAESVYQKVLALEEKKFGKTNPLLTTTLEQYSEVLTRDKKRSEAGKLRARLKGLQVKVANGPTGKTGQAGESEVKW